MRTPLTLLVVLAAAAAHAASFRVSQQLGGPNLQSHYYLDFGISDGTGIGNGNSAVTISGLSVTGGSIAGTLPDYGLVTDVSGGFTLTDADPYAFGLGSGRAFDFQLSGASATLGFVVTFDGSLSDLGDYFSYGLLLDNLDEVPTDSPSGRSFVGLDLPSGVATAYGASNPAYGDLPAPQITPVPEPGTLAALGLFMALGRRRRKGA